MHRVVIVGAGFGGLTAAKALIGKPVDVTIVDQRNFHTFQPMLYEVATAGLEAGDVAYPIRSVFGKADNVRYLFAVVTGVDWEGGLVTLADADPVPFDSVIVASGATTKYFGVRGAAQFSFPLYTLSDARRLRDHVLRRLEAADTHPTATSDGPLTFVVVGGGPTGVEVAGALAELLDVAVGHDGFRFDRSLGRIIIVDGLDRLLTAFNASAATYAADTLTGRGVELKFGRMVQSISDHCVVLDDGTEIPTETVVWAGGVSVEGTVASSLGAETGKNGRLVVEADLSLAGRPGGYAVGDAAAVPWGAGSAHPGQICPQLAQVAIQSGRHAAKQVLNRVEGRPAEAFRYHDKGIMATIGRRAAITEFPRGLIVRGTLGWLAWLGLHIIYLIGFRNKIVVLINWSWRYLSWGSGPRIIVGDKLELPEPEAGSEAGGEAGTGSTPVSAPSPPAVRPPGNSSAAPVEEQA
jgi:NADH dehydrogenase